MTLKFTIKGNQNSSKGNPIPYLRMTQKQKWTPQAVRYETWKQHVRNSLLKEYKTVSGLKKSLDNVLGLDIINMKLQILDDHIRMDIMIYWANEAHADPDNVWKGIADALFIDDKHLAGSFNFKHSEDKIGKVEVIIK